MTSKAFELAQLSFGDNVKAEFGASSDLQIYHNGSDSYVDDTGTGALILRGNSNVTIGKYTGETMGYFEADGSAYLYHNNAIKFQTSSVGSSTDQLFGISDSDTGIALGANGANIMQFYTGNNERARIDSSGNVGVGGTPSNYSGYTNLAINGSTGGNLDLMVNGSQKGYLDSTSSGLTLHANSGAYVRFGAGGSERMRIDSNGQIGVSGSTASFDTTGAVNGLQLYYESDSGLATIGSYSSGGATGLTFHTNSGGGASSERMRINSGGDLLVGATSFSYSGSHDCVQIMQSEGRINIENDVTAGAKYVIAFYNPNGNVGKITTSGSSTSYSTSSDYRLKENVVGLTGATDRLKQLKPKRFNFIADPETIVDGFLAHEAGAVVPEAVTGEKDEVDGDNNPVIQGIDQAKLVPLLTAALQEAIAKIETLETENVEIRDRLDALEAN